MKITDVIAAIIDLNEENQKLRKANASIAESAMKSLVERDTELEEYFIELGIDEFINKVTWYSVDVMKVNTDEERLSEYETYEEWKKRVIRFDQFPHHITVDEIMDKIEYKLKSMYKDLLNAAKEQNK